MFIQMDFSNGNHSHRHMFRQTFRQMNRHSQSWTFRQINRCSDRHVPTDGWSERQVSRKMDVRIDRDISVMDIWTDEHSKK